MILRNSLGWLLALLLTASGRVRQARRRALSGDVVTAIYFHRPNQKLFVRCIRWLIKHGYQFISVDDLLDILYRRNRPPKGAVWLSFDDGMKELLDDVLPLVRLHRIPVALFIPTGFIEGDGRFPWLHAKSSRATDDRIARVMNGTRDALTIAELKHVASFPEVTIGSHTVSHAVTIHLTDERTRFELGESKRTLQSWTGTNVKCFAYPVGLFDGRERFFLEEFGYSLAATTENSFITRETDAYLVPRFSIGDEISFPEAVCNMVGVWRPAIDPILRFLHRLSRTQSGIISASPRVSNSNAKRRL
jgi:poly-beta-1,6-N-acetyl-D-glucosamine N-deacetylase